jgi:hypothetical protein
VFGGRLPKLNVEGSNPFTRFVRKSMPKLRLRYLPTVGRAARRHRLKVEAFHFRQLLGVLPMPLLSPDRVPKYGRHKQSGQARVLLKGQHSLLGPYGSNASRRQYNRLITLWLANGQQVPAAPTGDLTVTTLINRFWEHARPTTATRMARRVASC